MAVEILALPAALERLVYSATHDDTPAADAAPILAVDLDASPAPIGARALAAARQALKQLPRPSAALCARPSHAADQPLAGHFDVLVSSETELHAMVEAVRRNPLASLVLVQLLRRSTDRDASEGLIAESLAYSTLQAGPEFAAWLSTRRKPPRIPAPAEPPVQLERCGDRLLLTLNRPEKRNAFSAAMRDGLVEGLRIALADASIGEVVLRGAGPAFCSGGDLDEFGSLPDPATAHAIRSVCSAASLIDACAGRVRAELHGACVGAGIELPAFAKRVVASPDTFFQLPELAMGLVPGAGGTISLPRRIGRQRTAWLAISGARLDAQTALDWGLVDELVCARSEGPS